MCKQNGTISYAIGWYLTKLVIWTAVGAVGCGFGFLVGTLLKEFF